VECLYYLCSHIGIDRPLSRFKVINQSLSTDSLAIVEPEPYSIITNLGSRWRIIHISQTFLPLGTAINRVPLSSFL
jgi:hypothetical protein